MFHEYLIEKFMLWSLSNDYKNVVNSIKKEKEKFMFDIFNHFASSFKDMPIYELHMFRVSFSSINMIECEVISITLPTHDKFHSLYIVYNDNEFNYFVINKTNNKLELINHNDLKVCGEVAFDLSNVSSLISNYILSK